jgi:transmembrane sensor
MGDMDTSPMRSAPDPDQLLDRILSRVDDPAELEELQRALHAKGVSPSALNTAVRFFEPATDRPSAEILVAERTRLLDRVRAAQRPNVEKSRRPRVAWMSMAGLGAVMLAVGLLFWDDVRGRQDTGNAHVYTTQVGETAAIVLSDGSRVTLAPNTTLSTAAGFGDHARDVTLQGQARFDVSPSARVPFRVWTAGQMTHVLGTTFDVRRYDAERATRVAVIAGKVALQNAAGSGRLTLTAGMAGRLSDSGTVRTDSGAVKEYTSWIDGQLVFTDARVGDLLAALGPWYGYEMRLAGRDSATLMSQHVSAVFDIAERAETLRLLRRLLGVTMTIDGSVVTLRTNRSSVPPRAAPSHWLRTHSPSEVGR